jgi:CRP-like cAMP-binding protein
MTEITLFNKSADAAEVPAGEVLFCEGDPGDVMFAVVDGRIDLTKSGAIIEEIGPGGIVGEMALIDSSPRSATATAAVPARVVAVDRQHFTYLVQEHPTFALQVMALMAERLRKANDSGAH